MNDEAFVADVVEDHDLQARSEIDKGPRNVSDETAQRKPRLTGHTILSSAGQHSGIDGLLSQINFKVYVLHRDSILVVELGG